MKDILKKIFLIPFILFLICLFVSFLEYKQITHINSYDERITKNSPLCGTFQEAKKDALHQCKNFFEFMTNRPAPIDLLVTIYTFVITFISSLFIFLFKKNKKYFYFAFLIFFLVVIILSLIYTNSSDPNAIFFTGELPANK
ncbi:MAG: hypothetical protein NTW35_01405 [Candidatus Nomurabacteria bacterium]|nr:hypothetical protein [Candidatus Nomurabacteria bacterium]